MNSWEFNAEKYLLEHSDPESTGYGSAKLDEEHMEFFRAVFADAAQPLDRGKMWKLAAEKCGMSVEELWFDANRTNAFLGAAPFYGGDPEGLAEFLSLQE